MIERKKGGQFRACVIGAKRSDSFLLPAGCKINAITTEKIDTDSVSFALGSTEAAIEVATVTVTGAATAGGGDGGTITVGGTAVEILDADTVEEIAAKIATAINADATSIWTAVNVANTAVVTLTAKNEGNVTNATFVDTDTTGATGSVSTSAGTLPADVMAAVTLSTAGLANQTIAKGLFSTSADQLIYVNVSADNADFNVYVDMSKFN